MSTAKKDDLKRTQKDYSLAFKLQVVDDVEKGRLTYKQAQVKYGIQGRSTVLVWLRKHGILDWTSQMPMKKKAPPKTYISQLEAKIRRLEEEKEILNKAIDVADDLFSTDIRKKYLPTSAAAYKAAGAKRKTKSVATALGYSRQNYYKQLQQTDKTAQQKEQLLTAVKEERKVLPRLGTRKLHYLLKQKNMRCGRDKLFRLLGEEKLLIVPHRRYVQTTNSRHWLRRYPNLAKEVRVTAPEQLWVSDITYLKTSEGTCYLNLVTDAWSRKIVGYAVADNMEADSMIGAYQMALKERSNQQARTIHHSDRGVQYCSALYVSLSEKHKCRISMTENGDPYENALAERMNRTMKEELGLGEVIKTREQAYRLVKEAVYLYNNRRPHSSLNYQTPELAHKKIPDKKPSYQGSS